MIIEVCAVIAVLAFVAAVAAWIRTLKQASEALEELRKSCADIQSKVDSVSAQSMQSLESARKLTEEVRERLGSIGNLFQKADMMVSKSKQVTQSLQNAKAAISGTPKDAEQNIAANRMDIAEIAEWTAGGIRLWQTWQAHSNPRGISRINLKKGDE